MKKELLKQKSKLVKRSTSFDRLIANFMDKSFELTEDNIKRFLTKLHNVDYQLSFAKLYTVKTVNDIIVGGYFNPAKREIAISVNALLNLSEDATEEVVERYKLTVLCAYFHETRHEQQMSEAILFLQGKNNSAFAKVFCSEFFNAAIVKYEPLNSLIEIDARLVSLLRILDLERRGVYSFKPESSYPVMLTLVQMLDGINVIEKELDNYSKQPFDCVKFLTTIEKKYPNLLLDNVLIRYHSREFATSFIKEYNEKFDKFIIEDYKHLMQKMFLNTQISPFTQISIITKYKFNILKKEVWEKLITLQCYRPMRIMIYDLLFEKEITNKDKNDIIVRQEDLEDYFVLKGIEYNRENDNSFSNNIEAHKEFEQWLRKRIRIERNFYEKTKKIQQQAAKKNSNEQESEMELEIKKDNK